MRRTLNVSSRGQLTLPTKIRKRFGIRNGGPIILEERDNELSLRPALVLEVEMYSDAQIAEWDKADNLTQTEKEAISQRLKEGKALK